MVWHEDAITLHETEHAMWFCEASEEQASQTSWGFIQSVWSVTTVLALVGTPKAAQDAPKRYLELAGTPVVIYDENTVKIAFNDFQKAVGGMGEGDKLGSGLTVSVLETCAKCLVIPCIHSSHLQQQMSHARLHNHQRA